MGRTSADLGSNPTSAAWSWGAPVVAQPHGCQEDDLESVSPGTNQRKLQVKRSAQILARDRKCTVNVTTITLSSFQLSSLA